LKEHRDRSQLPTIMEQVCNGALELHALGYTHRALEPSHIVLNLAPFAVRIISFSGALPST
jgi:serine/threonine protein kinase